MCVCVCVSGLDLYFIMLSVKQRDTKYYFLSLWYDSTQVSH